MFWLTVAAVLPLQVPGQHDGGGRGGDQVRHFPLGTGEELAAAFPLLPPAAGQVVGSHRLSGRRQQNLLRRGNVGADLVWYRISSFFFPFFFKFSSFSVPSKVMSIWPSHFAWARERSEKHSGAQRHYGERTFSLPRDRTASRAPCSLCERIATANQLAGPSLHPRISPEVSARLCPPLAAESTPLSAEARKIQPRCSASLCSVEDLRVSSRCRRGSSRISISNLNVF